MYAPAPLKRQLSRSGLLLLGPAFVAAVAYVDPGNFATNIAAEATYGYLLCWVAVGANLTPARHGRRRQPVGDYSRRMPGSDRGLSAQCRTDRDRADVQGMAPV